MNTCGLYIHIPWCAKKCPYCDFNSHAIERRSVLKTALPERDYIAALKNDLATHASYLEDKQITTIFFGGGTPSLFSADSIAAMLNIVREYNLGDNAEITLEANPGTVEQEKFNDFRSAGVNRLSIGVQSFDNDLLEKIGRIHDGKQAIKAAEATHYAGFTNFNLDLMFGLPQQSLVAAQKDVQTAMDLEPTHISHYQLTIEPETAFYKQPPTLPNDDMLWEMQTACQKRLAKNGFEQYEVSAYAKAEQQCQHNVNYWQFGDYVGIGAGAHGKYTFDDKIVRRSKVKAPFSFINNAGHALCIDEQRTLADGDILFEYCLNALRLNQGFSLEDFELATKLDKQQLQTALANAIENDLIEMNESCKTTKHGQRYLNTILTELLPT